MFLNVYLCVCVGTLHFEIRASLVSQAGIKVTVLEWLEIKVKDRVLPMITKFKSSFIIALENP